MQHHKATVQQKLYSKVIYRNMQSCRISTLTSHSAVYSHWYLPSKWTSLGVKVKFDGLSGTETTKYHVENFMMNCHFICK